MLLESTMFTYFLNTPYTDIKTNVRTLSAWIIKCDYHYFLMHMQVLVTKKNIKDNKLLVNGKFPYLILVKELCLRQSSQQSTYYTFPG